MWMKLGVVRIGSYSLSQPGISCIEAQPVDSGLPLGSQEDTKSTFGYRIEDAQLCTRSKNKPLSVYQKGQALIKHLAASSEELNPEEIKRGEQLYFLPTNA